jgi:hypothetical protein
MSLQIVCIGDSSWHDQELISKVLHALTIWILAIRIETIKLDLAAGCSAGCDKVCTLINAADFYADANISRSLRTGQRCALQESLGCNRFLRGTPAFDCNQLEVSWHVKQYFRSCSAYTICLMLGLQTVVAYGL